MDDKNSYTKRKHTEGGNRDRKPGRHCPSMQGQSYESKAELELNLARDVKGNEKCFHKDLGSKRKSMEKLGLLLSEAGDLVTWRRLGTECLFHLPRPAFRNPRPHRPGRGLEQGTCTLGRRGSGQGILKKNT